MKRFLSLVISICMLVSFLPQIPMASATEGLTIKYDIGGFMSENRFKYNSATHDMNDMTFESTDGFFEFFKASSGEGKINSSKLNFRTKNVQLGSGSWVAMKIYVPVAGTYTMKMYNGEYKTGTGVDVFLHKTDASTSNNNKVGHYDTLNENVTDFAVVSTPNTVMASDGTTPAQFVFPEAGDYILTFKGLSNYGSFGTFTLTNTTASDVLMSAKVVIADDRATVTGKMASGADADLSSATVKYSSENPEIATIDENTGALTKVAIGNAKIKATVTLGGATKTAETTYVVTSLPMEDSGATVVIGMHSGAEYSFAYKTDVKGITYDDTNGAWRYHSQSDSSRDSTIHTSYGIQTATVVGGWFAIEINIPVAGAYNLTLEHGIANSGGAAAGGMWILPGNTENIAESLVESAAVTTDLRYYVKDLEVNPSKTTRDLGKVTFNEPGKYIVVYKSLESGSNGVMYPGKITLDGGDEIVLASATSEISREVLDLADRKTAQFSASLYMSDGKKATDGVYALSYKSSNTEVATVSDTGLITAVSYGKATITASVENEKGYTVETSKEILVSKEGITVSYNIGETLLNEGIGALASSPAFSTFTYDKTKGFWRYFDSSSETDAPDSYLKYRPGNIQIGGGRYIAFEVRVPAAGTYDLEVFPGEYSTGVDVSVYMSQGKISTAEGNLVGTYNIDNDSISSFAVVSEPKIVPNIVIPEAGDYVFTFKSGNYGSVGTFRLNGGVGIVVPISAFLKDVESGMPSVYGYMSDGSDADFTSATVKWSSSDTNVATINEKNGVITPLNIGKTTITAEITVSGVTLYATDELDITEQPAPPLDFSGVKTEFNFFDVSSKWLPNENENQGAADANRKEDIRGITYEYTNETGDGNWEWFGASFTPGTSSVWAYRSAGSTGASYRLRLYMTKDNWVALKIKIPAAGRYSANFEYTTYTGSASQGEMYIIPLTDLDKVAENLNTKTLITATDYLDKTQASWAKANKYIGMLEFKEAGEHLIVFKKTSSDSGYLTPRKLTLDGVNCIKSVVTDVEKTTLNYNEETNIEITASKLDGTILSSGDYDVTFETSDKSIATVSDTGVIKAVGDGEVDITVTVTDGIETYSSVIKITAIDNTGISSTRFDVDSDIYVREKATTALMITMNSGNEVKVPVETISYTYSAENIANVDGDGMITGIGDGNVTITASANFRGEVVSASADVMVTLHAGKSEPTYYTYEKRETALENISKYKWAQSTKNSAVTSAEPVYENFEKWYNLIPGEGIPRGRQVGSESDPEYNICRYCGVNIVGKYGSSGTGGWGLNPVNRPWKVQCLECKRWFPSNDFESFYELGRDEGGYFDVNRALEKHKELFEGQTYGYGYLKNNLYPEVAEVETLNGGRGLRPGETAESWGVDDGWGYVPRDPDGKQYMYTVGNSQIQERHGYVALYNYSFWGRLQTAVGHLRDAYLYTGDIKYGRAGAIIMDRVADVLPSFDLLPYDQIFFNTHGGSGYGQILGRIQDCTLIKEFNLATDAFYPALTDSQVIEYLSDKAEDYGLANDKSSSVKIWENWEEGILLETFEAAKKGRINGNYGMAQYALAVAAISLDREPETTEMIEWIYATNTGDNKQNIKGGDFASQIVDTVDRDGMGNESAPNYNQVWIQRLYNMADVLAYYKGQEDYNPYENPKFVQMFMPYAKLVLTESHHPQIGDSGSTASVDFMGNINISIDGFANIKDDYPEIAKELAQYIYLRNGFTEKGLKYGIFTKNPESLEKDILEFVDEDVETKSDILTGYGFMVLRGGKHYKSANSGTENNNQRDFWMYYGGYESHGHPSALGLGIEAFGLNLAPDLGYPTNTGTDPNRLQWVGASISHNVVTINRKSQSGLRRTGDTLHFDDAGKVKVMDADASDVYSVADNYRRTVVMVEVNDDISYGVDFFRVTGGDVHTYSFHAQSENATAEEGLDSITYQTEDGTPNTPYVGSYASPDQEYGKDPWTQDAWSYDTMYPEGYTWMKNVRKDKEPESIFAVDFEIKDYRKAINDSSGIHLRMTQLNDFVPSEVAIVGGNVPEKQDNKMMPETLEYVLTQREGEDLDTLFTTVFEPYRNERYFEKIENAEVTVKDGAENNDDVARAVKITHTNGRIDYVVYATNNSVTYNVANAFDFRGFVGVYSINGNGENIYSYVNDGDIIGVATEKVASYKGEVKDFTKGLQMANYIDISLSDTSDETLLDIAGRIIIVENDGVQNGVYLINKAEKLSDGIARLDIGTVSLVRGHKDPAKVNDGYIYNIEAGQSYVIPASYVDENLPEFINDLNNLSATAGSSVSLKLVAESPLGKAISYEGTTIPKNASFDNETGTLTWKPSSSQIGDNHFAITARDEDGREATIHFNIKVYGSTTGGTGGGGGGTTAPTTPTVPDKPETPDTPTVPDTPETPDAPSTGGDENVRFVDLGSHTWAADSINSLADEEIIKGTSENTYSPANNITRADFAILLVRAFKKTSDNTENFADVQTSDYFAKELAIARNTGMVSGIGDNKFAPRAYIKRCDMMLMLYRVLEELEAFVGRADSGVPQYTDFDDVPDYAKDAVAALIGAGLVNGKNNLIAPNDNTTRAEVAVLLKRVLDFVAKE